MSSREMTKTAAAVWEVFCSLLDTEVTSMFIRSSRLFWVRSVACAARHGDPTKESSVMPASTQNRRVNRKETMATNENSDNFGKDERIKEGVCIYVNLS
jgi:hypothetical protein